MNQYWLGEKLWKVLKFPLDNDDKYSIIKVNHLFTFLGVDMKVTQNVQAQFNTLYVGYNRLEFTDQNGNEIKIMVSEDNILDIAKKFEYNKRTILEDRAEEAKETEAAE